MIPGGHVPGYPPGYRDPDWDGTEAGFRALMNARATAIDSAMSRFLPAGLEAEWVMLGDALPGPEAGWGPLAYPQPGPGQQQPPAGPVMLAAAAVPGDSHIWVNAPLPPACNQVTVGGHDSETRRLDPSMIRQHDGPGRNAVWLKTPLCRSWPTGTRITPG